LVWFGFTVFLAFYTLTIQSQSRGIVVHSSPLPVFDANTIHMAAMAQGAAEDHRTRR
jgi:hypothetical protein